MRFRFGRFATAFFCIAIFSTAASAKLPKITRENMESFRQEYGGFSIGQNQAPLLQQWQKDAKVALKGLNLEHAARTLAPKYGFSPEDMQELLELCILSKVLQFPSENAGKEQQHELHMRLAHFAAKTGYKPLAMQVVYEVLAPYGDCDADEFAALLGEAPDKITLGWEAVRTTSCPAWQRAFLKQAGDRSFATLLSMARYTGLMAHPDYLALYAYLTSDAGLAHVDPPDRGIVQTRLAYDYALMLFDLGLIDEGIGFVERLPPDIRERLLAGNIQSPEVHADSLAFDVGDTDSDTFRLTLAGAYFLSGRRDDAQRIFTPTKSVAASRAFLTCDLGPVPKQPSEWKCGETNPDYAKVLSLDLLLNRPSDDPYDLAEAFFAAHSSESLDGAIWAELACRTYPHAEFPDICDSSRHGQVYRLTRLNDQDDPGAAASEAAVRSARIPGFEGSRASFQKALEAAVARFGGKDADETFVPRKSIDPLPSRFQQLPLPAQYRDKAEPKSESWIKTLAPLPEGYMPVRIGRDGKRVAVISISQNYDPTGEVSQGGYWVHLSDDGGKTWHKPLYTGLAEFFPYAVLPESKMPLFDGDTLTVAVDIQELDTASITYPPVALRSKRHETNLYLRIPIADLECDSDGDGLTDIAEEHLLLDPHNPDTDGDGIPDGSDPMPNVKRATSATPEQKAVGLLLEKLFSIHTGAVIEPVDVHGTPSEMLSRLIAGAHRDPTSADRPIFVTGDPKDFAGLNPDHMMLVYREEDLAKLRRMSPDFHPVSFGKIVFNRAHDRGYFVWSSGWTGGTVRLRLVNGEWALEEISHWIS